MQFLRRQFWVTATVIAAIESRPPFEFRHGMCLRILDTRRDPRATVADSSAMAALSDQPTSQQHSAMHKCPESEHDIRRWELGWESVRKHSEPGPNSPVPEALTWLSIFDVSPLHRMSLIQAQRDIETDQLNIQKAREAPRGHPRPLGQARRLHDAISERGATPCVSYTTMALSNFHSFALCSGSLLSAEPSRHHVSPDSLPSTEKNNTTNGIRSYVSPTTEATSDHCTVPYAERKFQASPIVLCSANVIMISLHTAK